MKRIICLILALVLLMTTTACSGNFAQVNLNEPISISENGIVEKSVFDKIKNENAIATFTGASNDIKYEWTVFGSDINETKDVNLSVVLNKSDKGIKVIFSETKDLGFPALLSIHINEKWSADSATAFNGDKGVYSVSVTGSKTSILNISVNKIIPEIEILPDEINYTEDTTAENINPTENDFSDTTTTNEKDNYLSGVQSSDDRVYSDGTATDPTDNDFSDTTTPNGKDNYLSGVLSS